MNKLCSALIATLITATSSALAASTIPLDVHIGGRVQAEQQSGATIYTYAWPGIYFAAEFSGPELELHFNDDQNIFGLSIDDKPATEIIKPGKTVHSLKNLGPGKHKVRLEKLTETQWTTGKFEGFFIPANQSAGKAIPNKRQIEFIGDSYTVGYGNTSSTRDCTTDEVFKTTNTQVAFGPLTAKHFNADYQINASSGYGVVRNFNGNAPDKSLPSIYASILQDGKSTYQNANWNPQIVVIGLGTNDFSTPLNTNERWKTRAELQKDYVTSYTNFVAKLHKQQPRAYFVLMASDAFEGEIAKQLDQVVANTKAAGNTRISSIIFKGLDLGGCHSHPSAKDDLLLKQLLVEFINNQQGIWQEK